MKTRCPQCNTQFRLTESQIDAADGYVRCGSCESVFNVYDVVNQATIDNEYQQSLLNINKAVTEQDIEDQVITDQSSTDQTPDIISEDVITPHLTEESGKNSHPEESCDKSREPPHGKPHDTFTNTSTIMWSVGILTLITTFFIEYAWFNRNEIAQTPEIQTQLNKICQQYDCSNLSLRTPSQIELVSRNIFSHPKQKNALLVNLSIKNNANFSQPYPIIKIDFSDVRGSLIASRSFLPVEYHSSKQQKDIKQRLLPNADSNISLEIQDPGIQAMTYEFTIL